MYVKSSCYSSLNLIFRVNTYPITQIKTMQEFGSPEANDDILQLLVNLIIMFIYILVVL